MARAPRRAKTVEMIDPDFAPDNIEVARVEADNAAMPVGDLISFFTELSERRGDHALVVTVHVRASPQTPWSQLTDQTWRGRVQDFNVENLIDAVREAHGDGDYKIIPRINGRNIEHIPIPIGDPRKKNTTIVAAPQNNMEMVALLMENQRAVATQQMEMARAGREQTNQLITAALGAMGVIVPALFTNRAPPIDPVTMISSLTTAMKNMQPEKETTGGGMKETLETIVAVKALFGGDGTGGGEGGEFNVMNLVGQLGPKFMEVLAQAQAQRGAQTLTAQEIPRSALPLQQLAPAPTDNSTAVVAAPGSILAIIRPPLLFSLQMGYSADLAADMCAQALERNGKTPDEVIAFAGEFAILPDWVGAVAEQGLDLRAHREWAEAVLVEIMQSYSVISDFADQSSGGRSGEGTDGDAANTELNEKISESGID